MTSIAKKFAMAASALFLLIFLLQHLSINLTSVFSADLFNEVSHFMGTNPLIQFVLQPILIFAVVYHFVMGFVLEYQNRKTRSTSYAMYKGSANSSWMSRNMIYSGGVILIFLGLHFYDFWVPEMDYKYISGGPEDPTRYYEELQHRFHDVWRVVIYVAGFVFLGLHLLHGFQSAFQSIGARGRFTPAIMTIGKVYSVAVSAGFIFIAIYHFLNHS